MARGTGDSKLLLIAPTDTRVIRTDRVIAKGK